MSYVELLTLLKDSVKNDVIPKQHKAKVISFIERIEAVLWRYSY